ncbi:cytochrome c [Oceanobacter antarcticus]|uniref:Cytochrome c n=1 Tax=Oceanobacter antarcticus TaxID=3133425 RepID=A0ABW8NMG5_9GAMM
MKKWIALLLLAASAGTYAEHPAVEQRQQLFEQIDEQSDYLETLLDDKEWQQAEATALQLQQKVQRLVTLFPPESAGQGRSRQRVWRHWEEFQHQLEQWQADYRAVAAAAVGAMRDEAALDRATSACRSCHRKYRSFW